MSDRSYDPPLGIVGSTPAYDPDLVSAFALALRMHEGRYLAIPRIVQMPKPVAGADFAPVSVRQGTSWIVQSITAKMTASAVVATRVLKLTVSDGTTNIFTTSAAANESASGVETYSFLRGIGATVTVDVGGETGPLPLMVYPGGYVFSFTTKNIDVGDQWDLGAFFVTEIRERTPNERAAYVESLLRGEPTTDYPGLLLGL